MRGEWSPEVGRGESKHPSLPLARAERKPLDRKIKHPPLYQRERQQYTLLIDAIFKNCDKLL